MTHEANEATPRREFLKKATFLGSTPLLTGALGAVFAKEAEAAHLAALDRGDYAYPQADPAHTIYSVCLQCHTSCPIKCRVVDGVLVKIDGNPYCAQVNIYNVPYAAPLTEGASVDGKLCPKGQAGIETLYDPHRIRRVLKRKPGTARGAGEWITIDFNDAIDELVTGGDLFGEGHVDGLREICTLRDRSVAAAMSGDVARLRAGLMTVAQFQAAHADHLDTLIDPEHPDLGPKNNQFVFQAGRIQHGRKELMKWFTNRCFGSVNDYEHTTICEQSHHIAYQQVTNQWRGGSWSGGKEHMKPDLSAAEFVLFIGTGFSEANFGPPLLSQLVSEGVVTRGMKIAVVDPRLSRSAGKADWWIPITPGTDAAFALGMMRWMTDNDRIDRTFLENANRAAAEASGESSWTTAAYLVKVVDGRPDRYLRASEVGLGPESQFVVSRAGRLQTVDPNDQDRPVEGDLEASLEREGIEARTAFSLLAARVKERSVEQYAGICGLEPDQIIQIAREFTAHGKKAAVDFYRGAVQHTNGYYCAQAIITLNLLIGNPDWKGGLAQGGGHWHEFGGRAESPYTFDALHPDPFPAFGVKNNREKAVFQDSTLYTGQPAPRPWYPLSGNVYQEIVPSAGDAYPYPVKALLLHKGTPVLSAPAGHRQIEILRDPKKLPLFFACDIVIGETSMYADYIFPDTTAWERWGTPHATPALLTAASKVRQPIVGPLVETAEVDGAEVPLNLETLLIGLGKRLELPGFGADAFGPGRPFDRQEDWFLKEVANIAMEGDGVPAASEEEMTLFAEARGHLPSSVFDADRWRTTVGAEIWPHVVYVLNRGGRFEDWTRMYRNVKQAHPFRSMFLLWVEKVAGTRNSLSDERFDGLPRYDPVLFADGTPVSSESEYPFQLITFKEIFGGHSRTMPPDQWLGELMHENTVLMNRLDAEALGLDDGVRVRLGSPTNPDGRIDIGGAEVRYIEGPVTILEGIRPGVVGISGHFGHWAYGSRDVIVDGALVSGDPTRARGMTPNPLMLEDTVVGGVCLSDPIGGSASFSDTPVRLARV